MSRLRFNYDEADNFFPRRPERIILSSSEDSNDDLPESLVSDPDFLEFIQRPWSNLTLTDYLNIRPVIDDLNDRLGIAFPGLSTRNPYLVQQLEYDKQTELISGLGLNDRAFYFDWERNSGGGASSDADQQKQLSGDVLFTCRITEVATCVVCLEEKLINFRDCCSAKICADCCTVYLTYQIEAGHAHIRCPSNQCQKAMQVNEITFRLKRSCVSPSLYDKYIKSFAQCNLKPDEFLCPYCHDVLSVKNISEDDKTNKRKSSKKMLAPAVICPVCDQKSCSSCRIGWHETQTCAEVQNGLKSLKKWAEHSEFAGQRNARKCPKCKVWIQKSDGCDHMTCNRCTTEFCYSCGDRYFNLCGNHNSKLHPLGCRNVFLKDHSVLRRMVRGSVGIATCVAAPVALPVYGIVKLVRFIKE